MRPTAFTKIKWLRMISIKDCHREECVCGENEENEHIYNCRLFNDEEAEESYEKIYNGTTRSQEKVLRRFENNLKKKQEINSIPCDPIVRSTDLNV